MFDQLIHADWSVASSKRWMAVANRTKDGWVVAAPQPFGAPTRLLDSSFEAAAEGRRVLIGFDFPIGVPAAYGERTKLKNFRDFLGALGENEWLNFFNPAKTPAEIGLFRPFYPAASKKGVTRAELVTGLAVGGFDDLLRICERRTERRQAACSLFWTLGRNQVGKGALSGWQEVVRPALQRGASLWPFDGTLARLAQAPGVVLAETYPAEAYHMVNAGFRPGESKRRQSDRQSKSSAILAWADRHAVNFTEAAPAALKDGFGPQRNGEDQFDALMGLLKMIEVVDGRRAERTVEPDKSAVWEGWILGR